MIEAAKWVIMAILSKADVTDEELMTAFTEALINSIPLTYQSAHPNDDVPSVVIRLRKTTVPSTRSN